MEVDVEVRHDLIITETYCGSHARFLLSLMSGRSPYVCFPTWASLHSSCHSCNTSDFICAFVPCRRFLFSLCNSFSSLILKSIGVAFIITVIAPGRMSFCTLRLLRGALASDTFWDFSSFVHFQLYGSRLQNHKSLVQTPLDILFWLLEALPRVLVVPFVWAFEKESLSWQPVSLCEVEK